MKGKVDSTNILTPNVRSEECPKAFSSDAVTILWAGRLLIFSTLNCRRISFLRPIKGNMHHVEHTFVYNVHRLHKGFRHSILWRTSCCWCPRMFMNLVRYLHEEIQTFVVQDSNFTSPFGATNGVKPNCVLDPTPFSILYRRIVSICFRVSQKGDLHPDPVWCGSV